MAQLDAKSSLGASPSANPQMSDSDSDSGISDPLDFTRDEGWEDIEPDVEKVAVLSLFDEKVFTDVDSMLKYCKQSFEFDLVKVRAELELDFLETVKLINYIRSEVKSGNTKPSISKSCFEDEQYLKPVLDDDPLLYSFDDLEDDTADMAGAHGKGSSENETRYMATRLRELEETLHRVQLQYEEYREEVQKTILTQLNDDAQDVPQSSTASHRKEVVIDKNQAQAENHHSALPHGVNGIKSGQKSEALDSVQTRARKRREDRPGLGEGEDNADNYFSSYSFNEIHELMLKDTIRTDAYRDFIYDNKDLFKDKVVLDVGCGTGILSMFCAKAGAKMVIAVDNSRIIDKAREIVFENGLGDVVKCLRGKIEEVTLPVPEVDIIVSEWMGYCLLYEGMLDSVIWARDRYLSKSGLMVPSHATLRLAPLCDPDYIDSHVTFWNSVYGFNMSSMLDDESYKRVLVRTFDSKVCAAEACPFLELDLYCASAADLTFFEDFSVTLDRDVDSLDAWAIWFDIFFLPSRTSKIQMEVTPAEMMKSGLIAFTTGPHGPKTHWEQGVLLIDQLKKIPPALKRGSTIKGRIGYEKSTTDSRSIDISVAWEVEGVQKGRGYTWYMD